MGGSIITLTRGIVGPMYGLSLSACLGWVPVRLIVVRWQAFLYQRFFCWKFGSVATVVFSSSEYTSFSRGTSNQLPKALYYVTGSIKI